MIIIILGAGQVGGALAEHLSKENHDITLVDTDKNRLTFFQERCDIRTITGNASSPNVLYRAGADQADIMIALTGMDEVNMVACHVAFTLFKTKTKIARVRSAHYLTFEEELFNSKIIPIDLLISPEILVTNHIRRIIEIPNSLQVLNFANKMIKLVAVKVSPGARMVQKEIKEIQKILKNIECRIVAIYRHKEEVQPKSNTLICEGDEVFFLSDKHHTNKVIECFVPKISANKTIMIAGGGHIGSSLAIKLEMLHDVKVIEHNKYNTEILATLTEKSLIITGNATDKSLLEEEGIDSVDIFCAVTNKDEINIMSSLLAKKLGARKSMCIINQPAYVDIVDDTNIDLAISPHQATIGSLLTYIRGKDVVNVHSLRRGAAEAIEAIAHGKVVGKAIQQIPLPYGTVIGAVVRDSSIIMGHHDITIEKGDHVIIFVPDKECIGKVKEIFQT